MTEEIIRIEIDDSQVDALRMKLGLLGQQAKKTTGKTNLTEGLPGINREMRLILGRFPGMRQALQVYFRVKRLQMGLDFGTVAAFEASLGTFQGMLTIIATTLILVQFLVQQERERKKEMKQLRTFIMRERGVNQAGYERLLSDWQNSLRGVSY